MEGRAERVDLFPELRGLPPHPLRDSRLGAGVGVGKGPARKHQAWGGGAAAWREVSAQVSLAHHQIGPEGLETVSTQLRLPLP